MNLAGFLHLRLFLGVPHSKKRGKWKFHKIFLISLEFSGKTFTNMLLFTQILFFLYFLLYELLCFVWNIYFLAKLWPVKIFLLSKFFLFSQIYQCLPNYFNLRGKNRIKPKFENCLGVLCWEWVKQELWRKECGHNFLANMNIIVLVGFRRRNFGREKLGIVLFQNLQCFGVFVLVLHTNRFKLYWLSLL